MLHLAIVQKQQPIGIFDSGIGGLTVAKAIRELMPNESFIYFGDTAHLPYGEKSKEAIKSYAKKISSFLVENNCKLIVIACNTASSVAFKTISKILGKETPVIGVINPVADYAAKKYAGKSVGVIATKRTIKSKAYCKRIEKHNAKIYVKEVATPLLAPMIEEGYYHHKISNAIINNYLNVTALNAIDALVLGCTHYPLIKDEIKEYYNNKKQEVEVIDGAAIVAQTVKQTLLQYNLISDEEESTLKFYVSDYTPAFKKTAEIFFGEKIELKQLSLWNE